MPQEPASQPAGMPQYKLLYFNLRGRGEPVRWVLAAADQPYEDVRFSRETEWPFKKPGKSSFTTARGGVSLEMLLGRMGVVLQEVQCFVLQNAPGGMVVEALETLKKWSPKTSR